MNANPKQKSPTRQHATSLWPGLARILQCSLLTTALLGLAGSGQAAGIFDYGTTAPTAGTYDVLQAVSVSGNGPGGNYYVNNGNPPGQTFTTGNHSSGYQLSTIYVQEDSGGGGNQANDAYTLYFYSVSGTSQTLLSSYVTTNTLTVGTGHWIYISGLTNSLLANTTYGFGLVDNSGRYWRLANTSANPYAGGTACLFSTTAGARTIPTIDSSADAAFDVVLVGNPDPFVSSTIITPVNPVYAGSPVTLTAAYGGTGPFSFQWLQNSGTGFTNLAGSVTNTYSLNTTTMPAGSYQYELIVTGADGSATNVAATMTLDLDSGPIVTANTTVTPAAIYTTGSSVLSATFAGTLPIYYQWQYSNNGSVYLIPGATTSSYTLSNIQFTNAGYYSLIASNNAGGIATVVTSTPAPLAVTAEVVLSDLGATAPIPGAYDIDQFSTNGNVSNPDSNIGNYYDNNGVPCGQTFTTGSSANGYQLNSVAIKYGTVNGGHAAGLSYTLRIYSISGSTATLLSTYANQNTAPAITLGDWTSWSGGITNIFQANTTYAYTLNGPSYEQMGCASNNPYAGGNICLIPAAGGAVTLGASGNYDATFDLNLTQIGAPPTAPFVVSQTAISTPSTVAGYPVTMTAVFGGSTPLSYQWQFSDGATFTNNIPGATTNSYTINDAQISNTGYYSLRCSNSVGSSNSAPALLTVSPLTDVEIINFGSTAPPVSGFDIAQLSTAGNQGAPAGLNYYDNDNPPPGQTFTTGANEYGYSLPELYIDMGSINGGHASGVTYTLSIYSVSAGQATLISTYVNNNTAPAISTGTWTKWIGLTNLLAPNTTYAYTISASSGYLQVGNATGNPYAGGQVCLIPANGGTVNYGSDATEDATFLVHLVSGPVVPDHAPVLTSDTVLNPSGVFVGGSAVMSAAFSAIPLPTYQWMFNGGSGAHLIIGATNATYTLANAQLANSGTYYLVASNNPNGVPATAASSAANFVVAPVAQTNASTCIIADAGSSVPSVGSNDIAQVLVTSPGTYGPTLNPLAGLNYYVDNAAPPGQTFTTSNNPPTAAGFPLTSVYVQEELSTANGGGTNVQTYTLDIYQLTEQAGGTNAVLLTSYTTANSLGITEGDWIAFSGLTNLLQPNTTYAFSVHNNGSGYWKLSNSQNPNDTNDPANDVYPGGQVALLPASDIGALNFGNDPTIDAAFLALLTPLSAPKLVQDTLITPLVSLAGGTVAMSAFFQGSAPIHYQWQFTDTNGVGPSSILGATNTSYTITNALISNSGSYDLLAWNNLGTNSSTPTPLTVLAMELSTDTTISPASAYTNADIPVTMKAVFAGAGITYQWFFDNGNGSGPVVIPGATNAIFVITNFVAMNAGNYSLVASNSPGGFPSVLSSTPAPLNALATPSDLVVNFAYTFGALYGGTGVITPPDGGSYWNALQGTAGVATSVTSLAPDGSTPAGINLNVSDTYQFFNNGDASGITLFNYYMLNDNNSGAALPFTFTGLPQGVYNLVMYSCDGGYQNSQTTFAVGTQTNTADATTDATFIQNNNYVVFSNVLVTNGTLGGTYWFPGGHEGAFNGAQLQLAYSLQYPRIYISTQPASSSIPTGAPASVAVTAEGPGQLFYQWWTTNGASGAPVSGATNSALSVSTSGAGASNYYVVITNLAGLSTNSVVATVTVYTPDTLKWSGGAGPAWDLSTLNWFDVTQQAAGVAYADPDYVVLDDTATSFVVSNSVAVRPSSVTVNNSANSYVLTGPSSIGGLASLTKTGSSSLTINNNQTYTGGTTVNQGLLVLAKGGGAGTIVDTLNINPSGIVSLTAVDALGYNAGTSLTNVNIFGGVLTNNSGGNEGFLTTFNLTGGTLSSGGGAYNFNGASGGINSLATNLVSTISGPVALRASGMTISTAQGTVPGGIDLNISGVISGGGDAITKSGAGTLALSAVNTYNGLTTVSAGTLLVNGTVPGAVTVNSGAVLGGSGTIDGAVTIALGATVGATGITTLTLDSSPVLGGTATAQINRNGGTPAAGKIVVVGNPITFGGSLVVSNTGAALQAGDAFTLFTATGYSGAFTSTNLPSLSGGLTYSFANGVLSVVAVSSGPTGPAHLTNSVSGNTLSLAWPAGQGWRLQAQSNSRAVGLSNNWVYVTDGTVSSTNITIIPSLPTSFYRLVYP